ncbi:MFS transporter [Acuticoccus sp. MNP-M23]|uniref:MFS transporter n=1 Tax=Acuticoccus sp. MNP-M23 TaxID=3072793 RepID=UPI0028165A17|nr:MFS transporter [Acuticoccus sp. MNP-M23]WMS42434.1 MFS transporter [Acuticoccus sp. MNP-M23]
MTRPQLTALIIASALLMENVDSTVIATALPTIAADIGTDPIRLKLAITAYLLSLATFIPISGWAADRLGGRLVFRCAIVVFMLGSILCSMAGSLPEFVIARIIQGAGGAMMTPVGRLVLLRTTPKSELLSAMAWLTVPALMGPLFGPPLGGFIATYFDWRWIFWINIPVGIAGIILISIFIDDVKSLDRRPLDLVGFALSGIGLSGLVFGLSVLGQNMLPLPITLAMIGTGAISTALYLAHARKVAAPLLDLTLFRLPTFYCSAVGGSLFRIGIGSIPFLLPLMLQIGLGLSAFQAGGLTFFSAAGALLMKFTAKPLVYRFGFRSVLIWNGLISSAALLAMALFAYNVPAILMVSVLLVGGFFRSLQFTCLNSMAYAEVEQERMSLATSLFSVAQQVSLAAGVAIGAAVIEFQRAMRDGHEILVTDFVSAFATVALISLCSVIFYLRLPADAAAEMAQKPQVPPRKPVASM